MQIMQVIHPAYYNTLAPGLDSSSGSKVDWILTTSSRVIQVTQTQVLIQNSITPVHETIAGSSSWRTEWMLWMQTIPVMQTILIRHTTIPPCIRF